MLYVFSTTDFLGLRTFHVYLLNKIISEKNLTKLLKKRKNQPSKAPRTTGKSKYSNYFAVREFSCTLTVDTKQKPFLRPNS